ncbi:MAG: FKBP-type peptidyl-prolyl cis-trans isomerase [Alistipes sp.]|jgi:FKBP-type peptidyl-prolyl cis-trans isomerase SlyD|nr:FKBP-type peptidyl-prolyl cis-trans isomerase [Alistipes sp.]
MKISENTFVALDYKLEVDGQIADQSQPGNPLKFAYGMGMLLPKFEEAIAGLAAGDTFAFTLSPADGYGEVIKEVVVELPKNVFEVNGEVEPGLLEVGNMVPMADQQGNRLMGRIVSVGEVVTMDFNHPMAGKTLNFTGKVDSVRELSPEDLQGFAGGAQGGCSCGCEDGGECSCDDSCGCEGGEKKGDKGCNCGC